MTLLLALVAGIWLIAYLSLRRAQRQEGFIALDNLQVMFCLVLVVYGTAPPLFWLLQGGEQSRIVNPRLGLGPTLQEQHYLVSLGLVFGFSLFASDWIRKRDTNFRLTRDVVPIPNQILPICIILAVANFALTTSLQLIGVIRSAESYIDSYLVVQQLPLLLRIVLKITGGIGFFAKIVILVWLFQNWKTHKAWIFGILGLTLVSFDLAAGRSGTFLTLLICLILWNRFVKPLSFPKLLLAGSALLVAFTIAGFYRGMSERGPAARRDMEVSLGEFDAPWTNAVELYRKKQAGQLEVPFQLHFCELYNPIPAYFLPFEKWGYSGWFVNEYYSKYGQAGGGLMFGLFAQLVIGFGWPDVILRGFLLGWLLSWLTRFFRNGADWWHYPSLVYCAAWTFYSIRDSSFSILTNLLQVVLVAIIAIQLLSGVRTMRSRGGRLRPSTS
jgi:hypothetical protein